MSAVPSRVLSCILAIWSAAGANALAAPAAGGLEVCTVTGTSGEYSVRLRNNSATPLARAEVTAARLDAGGHAVENFSVNVNDIPAGKYKTAVLGRHGDSVALVSISTYVDQAGTETRQEDLYAGKVAHVSPNSAVPYTLAPLALRGWTVAYGPKQGDPSARQLEAGGPVLLVYPARPGKKPDVTRPEAGRMPADVVPLAPCRAPAGSKRP